MATACDARSSADFLPRERAASRGSNLRVAFRYKLETFMFEATKETTWQPRYATSSMVACLAQSPPGPSIPRLISQPNSTDDSARRASAPHAWSSRSAAKRPRASPLASRCAGARSRTCASVSPNSRPTRRPPTVPRDGRCHRSRQGAHAASSIGVLVRQVRSPRSEPQQNYEPSGRPRWPGDWLGHWWGDWPWTGKSLGFTGRRLASHRDHIEGCRGVS